jgi:hypothetical protein
MGLGLRHELPISALKGPFASSHPGRAVLENPEATPPRVVNPRTKETFVLLRADEYARLKEDEYDDSPWTREELQALDWEAGKRVGWEDMDEYDDFW